MNHPTPRPVGPASLKVVLLVTFLGSISSGGFWAAIFFVTAAWYQLSPVANLALAAAMGAVYAGAAASAGGLLRALERWVAPRTALLAVVLIWGAGAVLPLLSPGRLSMLWVAALVGAAASALTFPIVESYLTAGRQGADMRAAIGWFNVTWTPATAVPLLLMPLLPPSLVLWTLAISGVANTCAGAVLVRLPARPVVTPPVPGGTAHHEGYRPLLRAASWLLPLSYVMCSALSPILPHRLRGLGSTTSSSLLAAIWMMARFSTLFVMWRSAFWHGRWGALGASAVALLGGLCAILVGPSLPVVIAGLILFGAGMGLTYYAALYYSLAVGHGAVDAGGSFEALIGVGYCIGPLVGLVAYGLGGTVPPDLATAAILLLLSLPALSRASRPFFERRRIHP